jgi:thymidylate synthase
MKNKRNVIISGENLTDVWLKTAQNLLEPGIEQLTHLTVRITDFSDGYPNEHPQARTLLDKALKQYGACEVNANANVLFPESSWQIQRKRGSSAHEFTEYYHNQIMPKLAKQDQRNHAGTYFDRMVAYPSGNTQINQLSKLIEYWKGGLLRQSAYQISIYNPSKDLDKCPYMSFPCLDYLAFTKEGNELLLTAFYAYQLIFDRGYGNYLGLCRLGRFMAEQMNLKFSQLSCHVGSAKLSMLDKIGKENMRLLTTNMIAASNSGLVRKAA